MIGLKRNSLLLLIAIGLLGSACGDDGDKDDGNEESTDGTPDGSPDGSEDGSDGSPDGTPGETQCVGTTYGDYTYEQLLAVAGTEGACAGAESLKIVCEDNPNDTARTTGSYCYQLGKTGEELRTCTIEGDASKDGVKDVAPGLSDACYDCYAESVACTIEKGCAIDCVVDATSEACLNCRIVKGCTPEFYTCSGLPMPEDVTK